MPEVKLTKKLYKVTMTEYERGYGQRDMGTKLYDNEEEAKEYCRKYNEDLGDPDCYYRASYQRIV
jgi:hypothetical protein